MLTFRVNFVRVLFVCTTTLSQELHSRPLSRMKNSPRSFVPHSAFFALLRTPHKFLLRPEIGCASKPFPQNISSFLGNSCRGLLTFIPVASLKVHCCVSRNSRAHGNAHDNAQQQALVARLMRFVSSEISKQLKTNSSNVPPAPTWMSRSYLVV